MAGPEREIRPVSPAKPQPEKRAVFIYNHEWNMFEKSDEGHDDAFKKLIAHQLRKLNRDFSDENFDLIWKLPGEGKGATMLNTFRTSFMQGEFVRDRIELRTAAVTPEAVRWLSRILVHHFENKPLVLVSKKGEVIREVGNLHEIQNMPQAELEQRLAAEEEWKLPSLPRETIHDLMLEMGKIPETTTDMRWYLLEHVNDIRRSHGYPPLELHEEESANAKANADYMISMGSEKETPENETPEEYRRGWTEIVAHGPIKKSAEEAAHEMLVKKTLMAPQNLQKILGPYSHLGADVAVKDNRLALCIRLK